MTTKIIHILGEDHQKQSVTKQRIQEILRHSPKEFHYFLEGNENLLKREKLCLGIARNSDITMIDETISSDLGMLIYMYGFICTEFSEFKKGLPTAEQVYKNTKNQLNIRFQTEIPELFSRETKAATLQQIHDLIVTRLNMLCCTPPIQKQITEALTECAATLSSAAILKTVLPISEELRDRATVATMNKYYRENAAADEEYIVVVGKRHVEYLLGTAFLALEFPFSLK